LNLSPVRRCFVAGGKICHPAKQNITSRKSTEKMMNKLILIILVFQLVIFSKGFAQESMHAEITYIGNEGFMIVNKDKKVMIDALYNNTAANGIVNIDESLSNRIINNQEPFANSNLYLVTHGNADHFDQTMVSACLENNPQSIMVADSTLTKPMKASLINQIFSATPARYHSVDTILNGIPFSVYNLKHNSVLKIYNVGYWVNIDGLRIFHSGDNILEDTTEYLNTNLFGKQVDVAFLNHNGFLKSTVNSEFIKNHMKPRYIVLMHIPDNQLASVKEKVNKLDDSYPPIFVFNASMEKITLTDIAVISNHMPEKNGAIADTIIEEGVPVNIHVPFLFKDPDRNDSLTYNVTGLPAGLTFNSNEMNITGSAEKISNSTVKIRVTDKSLCSNSLTFKIIVIRPDNVSEKGISILRVYPIPATNSLWLNQPLSSGLKIQISDLQGRIFMDEFVKTNPVDISKLCKGTYILKLSNSKRVVIQKLIKE
jgi:L-ascorbate metabolism protein UlaG (beta-lactamase superfamily)